MTLVSSISPRRESGARRSTSLTGRDWRRRTELLCLLVLKDLRVRYKGSFLGYVWTLANPLAYTLVYYVTFQIIIRVEVPNYSAHLISGLFPWSWATGALIQSALSYRDNETLVKKVDIPRAMLPLATVLQQMLHFVFALPVVLGCVVLATGRFHVMSLILMPVMIVVQLAMLYPMALILASANVLVRDVEHLVGITLQLLFFLTPIVYAANAIPVAYVWLFDLNPFSWMVAAWRSVLYEGRLDAAQVGHCLLAAAVASLIAIPVHRTVSPRIAEVL